MSEEVRRLFRDALDVAPLDPSLRQRVMASLPARQVASPRTRFQLSPQLIAALLVVAVIAGLVYVGRERLGFRTQSPAAAIAGCRLPMAGFASPSEPRFGFLNLSSGTFTIDPSHSEEVVQHMDRLLDSGGVSFDRQRHLWLPVPPGWVSADGSRYVYLTRGTPPDFATEIHLRDLVRDTDTLLVSKAINRIVGWGPAGVYFTRYGDQPDSTSLSVVDPETRLQENLYSLPSYGAREILFTSVGAGAIWGSNGNDIVRLDLQTRTLSTWYRHEFLTFLGLNAAGQPILLQPPAGNYDDYNNPPEQGSPLLITGLNKTQALGDTNQQLPTSTTMLADGKRTWFWTQGQRVWLYTRSAGLVFLDESHNIALPSGALIAGGCA